MKRVIAMTLLAALAAAPTPAATPPATAGTVRVGDLAPGFILNTLAGGAVCLSQHIGKQPVLLVFWSYFCFPCQREMPDLDALGRELGPDALRIIGISLDGPQYDNKVLPYLAEKGITFPNAYDTETDDFFELAERYGVVGTPTSFLIDLQGRVRFIHLGRLEPTVLRTLLTGIRDPSFCPEIIKPAPTAQP